MGLDMEIRHNGEEVIYMRKENAIRNWFASHLDDFHDNGLTNLPKEKFIAILDDMQETIEKGGIEHFLRDYEEYCNCESEPSEDKWDEMWNAWGKFVTEGGEAYEQFCDVANELFPSQSGFFFGSTDYGVYYIRELIVHYYKFREFYNEMLKSGEEWDKDTVEYWEWY